MASERANLIPAPLIEQGVSNEAKINAVCGERDGLRQEIISYAKSMHQAMFAFLTASAAFAGLYWNPDVIKDHNARNALLIILTQVEFFLALFVVGIQHCAIISAAYIGALENKINKLAGDTISIWQTRVVPGYVRSGSSVFTLSFQFLIGLLLLFFGISLYLVLQSGQPEILPGVPNSVTKQVGGLEMIIILALMAASHRQRKRAYKLANTDLDKINIKLR